MSFGKISDKSCNLQTNTNYTVQHKRKLKDKTS